MSTVDPEYAAMLAALEAALEEKRAAIEEAASEPVPDLEVMTWRAGLAAGAGQALLAAVHATLKVADEIERYGSWLPGRGEQGQHAAEALREDIAAALTVKKAGHD